MIAMALIVGVLIGTRITRAVADTELASMNAEWNNEIDNRQSLIGQLLKCQAR